MEWHDPLDEQPMPLNPALAVDTLPPADRSTLTSGIRTPRVKKLNAGTRIFRFADRSSSSVDWSRGKWWIERPDFNVVLRHALEEQGGFGMGWSGRQALAVKTSWSPMDLLIEGIIREQINVFVGRGKVQFERAPNGMRIQWSGWRDIEQVFVPDAATNGPLAIQIYRTGPITSFKLF